ncbi:hypothetical protein [Luteibacter sp.]|uniref:beta strand repeat-containing protein n=1 Tax=Luteibacter sp. TaxID=1886636 RepID=UPI0031B678A7
MDASATGLRSVSIGTFSMSNGAGSVAIGGSDTDPNSTVGAGTLGARALADKSVALGSRAFVDTTAPSGVAIGASASVATDSSIAIGANALVGASQGGSLTVRRTDGLGWPSSNSTVVNYSMAIGYGAQSTGASSEAIGSNSIASGAQSLVFGHSAVASGQSGLALGQAAYATGASSIALGRMGVVTGDLAMALGNVATATGVGSVAMGNSAYAKGDRSLALGASAAGGVTQDTTTNTRAVGTDSVAIGTTAAAFNANGVALGLNAKAGASGSTTTTNDTAIGNGAAATGGNSVALGTGANATATNSLALGSNAAATRGAQTGYVGYAVGSSTSGGELNVANNGIGRQVTGVAAGSTGTDAVNVSQLNQVAQNGAAALGGGATLNATTGVWTLPSYAINTIGSTGANGGSTSVANVGAALSALNSDVVNTAAIAVKYDAVGGNAITLGATGGTGSTGTVKITNLTPAALNATSTDAVNGSQLYATNQQLGNIAGGGGIKYFHANSTLSDSTATDTNSVAIGPQAVAINANDVALGNGSTTAAPHAGTTALYNGTAAGIANAANGVIAVGGAGTERQVQNVAAGVISKTSTDAVNGSQVYSLSAGANQLGGTVASILGGGAAYDPNTGSLGGFSQPINTISTVGAVGATTALSTVAGALSALNTNVNNTANIAVKYDKVGGNAITLGATGGAGATGTVKITNLAPATLNATSTDAVNGSQVYALSAGVNQLGNSIANTLGGSAAYDPNTSSVVGFNQPINAISTVGAVGATTAQGTVAGALSALNTNVNNTANIAVKYDKVGGNAITLGATGGAGATGTVKITNLAPAALNATSTDAVNGSQVYALSAGVNQLGNSIANTLGGSASYDPNTSSVVGFNQPINAISTVGAVGATTAQGTVAGALSALNTNVNNTTNIAVKYDKAGGNVITLGATGGTGSIGAVKITNLAPAALNTTSTDAVNGSQLYATNQQLGNIASGGGIKYFHANSTLTDSSAGGVNSVAIGAMAAATGNASIAQGFDSQATADSSVAIGWNSQANAIVSTALGDGAKVTVANSVAIGSNAVASTGAQADYAAFGLNSRQASFGEVSLGSVGAERKVTNIAAGSDATDAVNVAQLKGAASSLGNAVASHLGGGAAYDSTTGTITAPSYSVQGATFSSVGGALDGLNTGLTSMQNQVASINNGAGIKYFHANSAGNDSLATGTDSVAVGPSAVSAGAHGVAMGDGAQASRDNSVALGANSTTSVGAQSNYTGAYMASGSSQSNGEVSVGSAGAQGSSATYRQVTNVADGSGSHDAVNVQQLQAGVGNAISQSNAYTDQQIGNVVNNGSNGSFRTNATGANGAVPAAAGANSAAGGAGAVASATNSTAVGNNATATGTNAIALGQGSVARRDNTVSVGDVGKERQVANVAAGTQGTDAVNVNQLNTMKAGGVRYDQNADGSVNASSVTLNPGSSPATVHNVAARTATTDAVNVGQLSSSINQVQNWSKSYTDQRFETVNRDLNRVGNRANAGVASAMAMASLPQAYQPNQNAAAVSMGSFHGETGIAIGVSTITESGRYILKLNATTNTRGDAGVGVGAAMVW